MEDKEDNLLRQIKTGKNVNTKHKQKFANISFIFFCDS